MPLPSSTKPDFEVDFRETMDHLRGSLAECLSALAADPFSPRALGRQLELDKSLAWKVAQLARPDDTDAVRVAQQLPGPAGQKLVVEALRRANAPNGPCDRLEVAFGRFRRLVEVHGGNRAGMDVMLASLSAGSRDARGMENSRKQAFQGNSAIWGVQVRMRLGLHVVAPSRADPERVTIASVAGFYDFQRLRADARWPLVSIQDFGEGRREVGGLGPLDIDENPDSPLLPGFSSENLPPLEVMRTSQGQVTELSEGPLGKSGAQTFVFGHLRRSFVPMRGQQPDEFGEYMTILNTPAERAQLDLLLHRDLPFPGEPTARLFSKLETGTPLDVDTSNRYELPLAGSLEPLAGRRPTLASPHVPRYPELVDRVLGRFDAALEDFQAWRLTLRYPPIPTIAVLRHSLAPPAGG